MVNTKRIKKDIFLKLKAGYQIINNRYSVGMKESPPKKVIFVAGNQRSGTNMVMDIFEKSLKSDVYHETDPRAFQNYIMRDISTIQRLFSQSKAPVFIIKSLCESQRLKTNLENFHHSQGIWVYRNYDDVVNSMMRSFNNMAKQAKRIAESPEEAGWLSEAMSDSTYQLVNSLVDDSIDDASASALQWYYRNILFFDQKLDTNSRVRLIKYESLVRDPQKEFKGLFEFCGLDFKNRMVIDVFKSSIKKKRPQNIRKDIRDLCDGLTRRMDEVFFG
ncbi:sulfotransferase domain-containing protein [Desulfospira joergensenii]|uniref:sulfotransferase domain-containing protein n=1 Tax=Desulfospira joergensenii TaxID=53329 RepID=UPI0003B50F56|nr:sulfotransferase domain-containing protein [Desulfospira joergensenii]